MLHTQSLAACVAVNGGGSRCDKYLTGRICYKVQELPSQPHSHQHSHAPNGLILKLA